MEKVVSGYQYNYLIGVKGRAKGRVRSERDNRRPMKKGIDSGETLRVTQ